jgi:hypothetical protein
MINIRDHPIGWAQMMFNLEDAHEHLGDLIKEMETDPDFGDSELAVSLGHVVATQSCVVLPQSCGHFDRCGMGVVSGVSDGFGTHCLTRALYFPAVTAHGGRKSELRLSSAYHTT